MSGICGWFDPNPGGASSAAISAMATTLARFDASPVRTRSAPWGAVALAAREANGDLCQDGERLVVVHGRARISDARLWELARQQGLARAIAAGYAERQAGILKLLEGSFSLAILDGAGRKALLASDRMGTRSLCYAAEARKLVFGSTLDAISAYPDSKRQIRRQAIYDYVHFHVIPGPDTAYVGRSRLEPGTFLIWDNGQRHAAPYWSIEFVEDEKRPFPVLKEEFLTLLR